MTGLTPTSRHLKTMQALILQDKSPSLVADQPRPEPLPGEALIRPLKAAVSATDLELCRGLHNYSGVLGHEFVGLVESVNGEDSKNLTGQRVVGSIATQCGECDLCRSGLGAHCRSRTILGIQGRNGCFAEQFTLPLRNLVPVPDHVDNDHAIFAHPLAAALHAASQLTISGKPYITVLGDGPLGLLTAQVMARLNASVRLIGRYSEKLALCEKWGIKHRHLDDIGRRADQDVVVDCTGSPTGLPTALGLVRPRGKIVLKTLLAPASAQTEKIDLALLVSNEVELIGSSCGSLKAAVTMLGRLEYEVLGLIGKRMRLSDGPKFLHAAAQPGELKVIIDIT